MVDLYRRRFFGDLVRAQGEQPLSFRRLRNVQPRLAQSFHQVFSHLRVQPLAMLLTRPRAEVRNQRVQLPKSFCAHSSSPSCPQTAASAACVKRSPGMLDQVLDVTDTNGQEGGSDRTTPRHMKLRRSHPSSTVCPL